MGMWVNGRKKEIKELYRIMIVKITILYGLGDVEDI